ncbi:hypothetical protein QJS10_CPA05g00847 [Acorus calamus]|uniref:magnesium chelatase n=1 Tax=Acorus calamus TaxID=4465 RepID=A0AAV9EVY8_ACOCL|nr:hypothetical protein QJS10_CPA05g00847 [Acorus calamus]
MASLVSTPFTLPTSRAEQLSSLSQKHVFLHRRQNKHHQHQNLRVRATAVTGGGNGLFTQTKPEVRRIIPDKDSSRGLPTVKIVYVVLEAQYQSSLSAAVRALNRDRRDAAYELVGYLVEELRDDDIYVTFRADLKDANVFIGSLIFVEELAQRVKAAVEVERDRLDAVLVFPSMPEVMRLNKLGSFSMSQLGQSKSPFFQLFKRKKNASSAGFADSMLKLVRTLPKVLKYLPSDKAQDARLYILSLQFWLGGSPENLQNFLKMISGSYVPALKGTKIQYSDPVLFLDAGLWHPLAPCMFEDPKEYLNWYGTRRDANEKLKDPNAPVIGLILQRSHIVTGDDSHYVAVIMELEARGAKVMPIFAGGLDFSGPVERYLVDPVTKKPFIHSVVSLTGFALVGGPARQDHPRAIEALTKLDVPYIVALPLVFQTTEEWLNSTLGLHPIQVALQVALPELDGGMEPIVFSGRDPRTGEVEQLCTRAIRWAELKRKSKAEKKLAITVFSFPPDKGNVGTAAYLNVFSSIYSVLKDLKRDGYNVDGLPDTPEALIEEVIHDKEAKFSSPSLNIIYKMSVREYQTLTPYAPMLEESWGKPPGNLNSDGENLLVYGKRYGNVMIGVQPTFGYEGDPMRLLFSKSASPHHGFAAYYSYVEKIFGADAVLHFGTHGSLEFMPGKQVGMSDACYPDSLIGNIPNIYYYAANNPSEATIAKRRSYANTISYLTPPAENAGLYKGLKQLAELISSYQSLKDTGRGPQIVSSIVSTARQCNLDKDVELPGKVRSYHEASRGAISTFVDRTTNKKGQVVDVAEKLGSMLGFGAGEPWVQYLSKTKFIRADREKLRTLFEFLAECLKLIVADNDLAGSSRRSRGVTSSQGPAGTRYGTRSAANGEEHSRARPAVDTDSRGVAERQSRRGKADRAAEGGQRGKYPETIALVLWGTDNIKTYGESLAQVLWMVGVRPIADSLGRVNRVEPVSLEELGRPRIDVVVNCSGVFRDLFINQMNLLDRAVKMVAELDEPEEMNFVRKHARQQAEELGSLRKDKKKPSAYIADTTTANAQVRTLAETVRLDARTKLLNPKWYEGMMKSGYEGVREIEKRLTNTVGWSATSGQVDNWVYEEATRFIKDEEMLKRLLDTNPNSFRKLVQTFLEASGRGYWETSEENLERLRELYSEVEDKIEGIDR